MKVIRLSALRTGRLYPPRNTPGTHFSWRLSPPQGHSAAGRIMPMKNSNEAIGNRTRNLPGCVPDIYIYVFNELCASIWNKSTFFTARIHGGESFEIIEECQLNWPGQFKRSSREVWLTAD